MYKKYFLFFFLFFYLTIYCQEKYDYFKKLDSLSVIDSKCNEQIDSLALYNDELITCADKTAPTRRKIYAKILEIKQKELDELNLNSLNLTYLKNRKNEFITSYSKILNLDNFDNINVQNALIAGYSEKYEGGKFISYKFDNKKQVEKYILRFSDVFTEKIVQEQLKILNNYYENEVKKTEDFLNRNLKRLNISRTKFDEMSENDQEILWREFR